MKRLLRNAKAITLGLSFVLCGPMAFGQIFDDEEKAPLTTADMLREDMGWAIEISNENLAQEHSRDSEYVIYRIEGSVEKDGKQYAVLNMYWLYGYTEPLCGLRCDGDKVYARMLDKEDSDEYLIYDFSLKPGDGAYISYFSSLHSEDNVKEYYVKCLSTEKKTVCDIEYEYLNIMCYTDNRCESPISPEPFYWIKGLGSEFGVLDQLEIGLTEGNRELKWVYYTPYIAYIFNINEVGAGVQAVYEDIRNSSGVYGINGLPASPGNGVYIIHGKKYIGRQCK